MIKVLDSFIADKIAAGEVIERPVSIVKELVENSIDAGAESIIVEIRNGGKSYIRVTDNGCGIPSDEIETAFERHATSKISELADLGSISTLGFRGEALASIAAVSRLTIISRTEQSAGGIRLILHGGRKVSREDVGTNIGTTILVEDVFYNTPARRKFMGTDARETAAIVELIESYAVCYTNIRFMLINSGMTVFTTEGKGDDLAAIKAVNPSREYDHLITVSDDGIKAYISDPATTRSTRRGQLFFVNGRLVNSKVIEKGLEKGYGDRVFSGYPIAILFIEVDPSEVDVNIHPGKKEIKFLYPDAVVNRIGDAVSRALSAGESVPKAFDNITKFREPEKISYNSEISSETQAESVTEDEPLMNIREYLRNIDEAQNKPLVEEPVVHENITGLSEILPSDVPEPVKKTIYRPFTFDGLVFKGYAFNTYIIMEKEENLFIFDQHAAHERVFYERFMRNYRDSEQVPQPVLTPFTLNVTPDIYLSDRSWLTSMEKMGYDISDFGNNTFIIRGIPSYMDLGEAERFASAFAENIDDFSDNYSVIDKLIMKSCKSAVKANEKLSAMEVEQLMADLSQCENPFSCPHGRPTFVKISKYDIERTFRRK